MGLDLGWSETRSDSHTLDPQKGRDTSPIKCYLHLWVDGCQTRYRKLLSKVQNTGLANKTKLNVFCVQNTPQGTRFGLHMGDISYSLVRLALQKQVKVFAMLN